KVTRALRGSAQMAREDRVYRVAVALEGTARALAAKTLWWNQQLSESVTRTIQDLRALIAGTDSEDTAELRAGEAVRRLDIGDAATAAAAAKPSADGQFRQWASIEVAAIAGELDGALQ